MLVAGRCVSSTQAGHGAIRIMPSCVAMGEAAGVAAAISVREGVTVRDIDQTLWLWNSERAGVWYKVQKSVNDRRPMLPEYSSDFDLHRSRIHTHLVYYRGYHVDRACQFKSLRANTRGYMTPKINYSVSDIDIYSEGRKLPISSDGSPNLIV